MKNIFENYKTKTSLSNIINNFRAEKSAFIRMLYFFLSLCSLSIYHSLVNMLRVYTAVPNVRAVKERNA